MAKRPPKGRCVHCLKFAQQLTWDHVPPKAWYPESMPPQLEKWKVPSCIACNNALSKTEEDLIALVAMCLDPKASGSKGIWTPVLNSMKPELARDERDRIAREKKAARLHENIRQAREAIAEHGLVGLYPGLASPTDEQRKDGIPIRIPQQLIREVCEKIVRGHAYLMDRVFIEPPFRVMFYALDDESAEPMKQAIARFGQSYSRGDAIAIKRVVVHNNGFHAMYEVKLWQQFGMYAIVSDDAS